MSLPDEPHVDPFAQQEPGVAAQNEPEPAESEPEGLSAEEVAEHQRLAEQMAHPHAQLSKLLDDLRGPSALDINGRIGLALQGISRLAQIVLNHTPPPELYQQHEISDSTKGYPDGEVVRRPEYAQGSVGEVPAGRGF